MRPASVRRASVPPRRRDEARALFRNAILEAAEAVFAERGFHRARIQDVAERARIAVGTVYNHFEQKEDVLRALLEERMEGLLRELERRDEDPRDFEGSLVARVARTLRYVESHLAFFTIAAEHGILGATSASANNALGGKAGKNVARARATFVAIVDEGIAAGVLDPIDPVRLARVLGALLRAFTLGAIQDGTPALAGDAELIVRLFLHGASKSPPRASKRSR